MTEFWEDRQKAYERMCESGQITPLEKRRLGDMSNLQKDAFNMHNIGQQRQLTTQELHVIEFNEKMRELSTKVKDITHLKERVESLESQVRRLRGIDE